MLKQAGVVDAGGQGLIVFLIGCLVGTGTTVLSPPELSKAQTIWEDTQWNRDYPYCTSFVVKNITVPYENIRTYLDVAGGSLVFAEGSGFIKIHIHTANPGIVLVEAITCRVYLPI